MDETPKGWYIQYVDRDPETIRRQEEQARKKKHDLDDEERSARFIAEQVRRGRDGKEDEVSDGCRRAGSAWDSAWDSALLLVHLKKEQTDCVL